MTRVVISGYASLDHVVELNGAPSADRTTIMQRSVDGWGRLGGSPSYVGRAMATEGVGEVALVSWVGEDSLGRSYREAIEREGLSAEGVEARPGRTPVAILAYQPDGGCICLYDPGVDFETDASARQREIAAAADWVCVTVGPPRATRSILAAARTDARVVWAVKNDPNSSPPDLVALLAARADVVSHSRGEAEFVKAALAAAPPRDRLTVETLGPDGARAFWRGERISVGVEKVAAANPTGAGDAFLGGLIVGLIETSDPSAALVSAAAAARRLLLTRQGARCFD
jgi:sugar/nucleoside kinase (ribokinase family)